MTQLVPNFDVPSFEVKFANPHSAVSFKAVGNEAIQELGKAIIISAAIVGIASIIVEAMRRS